SWRILAEAGADEARLEPLHADHVVQAAPQSVGDAVLGSSMEPRAMPHRNLDDARATELAQRRKETVDADEHRDSVERLAPVRLERAADVGDAVADQPAPETVRDLGRYQPHRAVEPSDADARDDVGVGERREQLRHVGGVVL